MEFHYLPVEHDELPLQVMFEIEGQNFTFNFDYNERFDFYTLMIVDENDEPVFANKLTYLSNALNTATEGLDISTMLIPLIIEDVSREFPEVERISKENFESIRMCLI